ncbi:cilia- and flagella-associated protein 65 [Monomorium pharaonis]|uniref:cilia- and flagella-associated protein 65 n=1 Tax=Monomorium pharaonis TaxID=307658 RepID=UPI00102E1858|nr:cilia- and flagella-associated protein 65 [Monomorium pharaonis]
MRHPSVSLEGDQTSPVGRVDRRDAAAFERTDIDRAIETSRRKIYVPLLARSNQSCEKKKGREKEKYCSIIRQERKEKMHCEANRKIHMEFGEVETGAMVIKWLEIINESCIEHTYEARRDATTNPLDHVFELCGYSWSLLPGQTYKCKIYYRPFVPLAENIDYFTIENSAGERLKIQVRGTCIGPVVSSSATKLVMVCTNECREAKKRIRLINDSKVTATFMFDVDPLQGPFQANPQQGQIGPRSRKCVTITFAPRENGLYTCHFPCLILNHVKL